MKRNFVWLLAAGLFTHVSGTAQDFDGKKVAAALTRKDIPPAPRLADGHPDLGNDNGSWEPPGLGDMAGTGGGFAGTIQAFVPNDLLAYYVNAMNAIFGPASCNELMIRPLGAALLDIA